MPLTLDMPLATPNPSCTVAEAKGNKMTLAVRPIASASAPCGRRYVVVTAPVLAQHTRFEGRGEGFHIQQLVTEAAGEALAVTVLYRSSLRSDARAHRGR